MSERLERIWACEEVGDAGTVKVQVADAGVAELFASASIGLIVSEGDEFSISNQPNFYPLQNEGGYWVAEIDLPSHGVFTIGFEPVMRVEESVIEAEWSIYPNPAQDFLNIESRYVSLAGAGCRALDVSGRQVARWTWDEGQRMRLDISTWRAGLYLIEISKNGQRQSLPFLKQ